MEMKLQTSTMLLGGDLTESNFSIGDPRIIIHHLVKNVYQDPKKTMIQEYCSNARDANIEAGKIDKPIEITLPTILDPYLKIKDNGIGISPSRMHDIFVKIGNSTKRTSNDVDGCFGIGGKIGFAYTSQFTVTTTHKDKNDLITHTYSCVQRDDFSLKLIECGQPVTNEETETGTTITIPINEKDIKYINESVIDRTQYWTIRPILVNNVVSYPTVEKLIDLQDVIYVKESTTDWRNEYYRPHVYALINGIPYPLKHNGIKNINCRFTLLIKFNVGEIKPALSRENIHYDDKVIATINQRIETAIKNIYDDISNKIINAPTYKEALRLYEMFSNDNIFYNTFYNKVKNLKWKNMYTINRYIKSDDISIEGCSFNLSSSLNVCRRDSDYTIALNTVSDEPCKENNEYVFYTVNGKVPVNKIRKFKRDNKNVKPDAKYVILFGSYDDIITKLNNEIMNSVIPNLINLDAIVLDDTTKLELAKLKQAKARKSISIWHLGRDNIETTGTLDDFSSRTEKEFFYFTFSSELGRDNLYVDETALEARKEMEDGVMKVLEHLLKVKFYGVSTGNISKLDKKWKPVSQLLNKDALNDIIEVLTVCAVCKAIFKYNIPDYIKKIDKNKVSDSVIKKLLSKNIMDTVSYIFDNFRYYDSHTKYFTNVLDEGSIRKIELDAINMSNHIKQKYPLLFSLEHHADPDSVLHYIKVIEDNS